MREIEIKAKLNNYSEIEKKIESLGCKIIKKVEQIDSIFIEKNKYYNELKRGDRVLRIRKENGKNIFTLKISQSNELDCIEENVVVEDDKKLEIIIDYLGYKKILTISKKRKTCKYNNYKICLDRVEGLGDFIEIEQILEYNDSTGNEQAELKSFLNKLFGVDTDDIITQGYDTLLLNKTTI